MNSEAEKMTIGNYKYVGNNQIISSAANMIEIFGVINAIIDDLKMDITKEGWKIASLDPANVASIILDLPLEVFTSYEIEKPFILDVNAQEVLIALEDTDDILHNPNAIKMSVETVTDNNIEVNSLKFQVKDIVHTFKSDIVQGKHKRPMGRHLDTLEQIVVRTEELKFIVKSCSKFSDSTLFESVAQGENKGKLHICSESCDHRIDAYIGENVTGEIRSCISLDYLKDMVDKINIADNYKITLYLGVDFPMTIQFKVCKYGTAFYSIAPRITTD